MSTSLLYHAFRISNVEYRSTRYVGNSVTFKAEMSKSSKSCSFYHSSLMIFKGKKTRFMHRLPCKDCGRLFWPRLQFMNGNRRYTRSFALTFLDLLQFATIRAVADSLNVGWDMVT